jgi:hypothetical protein
LLFYLFYCSKFELRTPCSTCKLIDCLVHLEFQFNLVYVRTVTIENGQPVHKDLNITSGRKSAGLRNTPRLSVPSRSADLLPPPLIL